MTDRQKEAVDLEIKIRSLPIMTSMTVPVRSGNLKNSFQYNNTENGFEIVTSLYYMPYTNEPWIHPRWQWENPNLKWFEEQAEYIAKKIATSVGGKYVRIK